MTMHKTNTTPVQAAFADDLAARIRTGMDSVLAAPKPRLSREDVKKIVLAELLSTLTPLMREAGELPNSKPDVTVNEDPDVPGLYHFQYALQMARARPRQQSLKICKPADMSDAAWAKIRLELSEFVDRINSMNEAEYAAFLAENEV